MCSGRDGCQVILDLVQSATTAQSTGCPINNVTIRIFNISITAPSNVLIFLSGLEVCAKFISIKTCLEKLFVKYHYWLQPEKFTFSQIEKKSLS